MDYKTKFNELKIKENPKYPRNDIGTASLYFDIHCDTIVFVTDANAWFSFDGKRWQKDGGGMGVSELCKDFVQAFAAYAKKVQGTSLIPTSKGYKPFQDYAEELHSGQRRKSLLTDARSIVPQSLTTFDNNPYLFNCQNGTYNLKDMTFQQHDAKDFITKISRVGYVEGAVCKRWLQFINEVMCGDKENSRFLQKSLGYGLSGLTHLECLFILYGATTRNGKSTLLETLSYIFGDYAMTMQPQTLARRNSNGSAPSPDIARLKAARLVGMPEPAKGLELDAALVKQVTGGDAISGRLLFQNPIEFRPDFKIYINTNYLPKITDNTVFESGRIKVIPFERHFEPSEQDSSLKKEFRRPENMSGILNWLLDGHRMLSEEGLTTPKKISAAIDDYHQNASSETDTFFEENLETSIGNQLKTSYIHKRHVAWAKANAIRPMSNQELVGELRRRYEVKRDGKKGNVIVGFKLNNSADLI